MQGETIRGELSWGGRGCQHGALRIAGSRHVSPCQPELTARACMIWEQAASCQAEYQISIHRMGYGFVTQHPNGDLLSLRANLHLFCACPFRVLLVKWTMPDELETWLTPNVVNWSCIPDLDIPELKFTVLLHRDLTIPGSLIDSECCSFVHKGWYEASV